MKMSTEKGDENLRMLIFPLLKQFRCTKDGEKNSIPLGNFFDKMGKGIPRIRAACCCRIFGLEWVPHFIETLGGADHHFIARLTFWVTVMLSGMGSHSIEIVYVGKP